MKKSTTLILFLTLLGCSFAFAKSPSRAPAIDPVVGLDIQQYNDVSPDQAKGYDWNQTQGLAATENKKSESIQDFLYRPEETNTENGLGQIFLLILGLCLPFALWFGISKTFTTPTTTPGLKLVEGDTNSPTHKQDPGNDDQFPKAS
ncbi:MAG: hypothetical protein HN509_18555 [Halobacteriovoraceae bacterium]|jgi:hypothetical protein|nr:hypothetical protein [Halobacteriovoraceae bacterium]